MHDKAIRLAALMSALMFSLGLYGHFNKLRADTGHEGATRIERGSYSAVRLVGISSFSGTAIFAASVKRPDGTCFNNTANTVWIGTVSAQENGVTHSNIRNGLALLSSAYFSLDGSNTGAWYATADVGVSSAEFRCLDGLVR